MQPEWTSVDVALPPEDKHLGKYAPRLSEPVLGWDGEDIVVVRRDPNGAWYAPASDFGTLKVTHWMPLPDPPDDGHLDPHQADIQ